MWARLQQLVRIVTADQRQLTVVLLLYWRWIVKGAEELCLPNGVKIITDRCSVMHF